MHSRYEQQMCRVHCNVDQRKAKGTNGRVIEDNPGGFTSAECITDAVLNGGTDNHIPPFDSRYPIPIPYDLCILTKYHR